MIIAGWLLAILGLAQVVYSGTIDVTQLVEGNRLLGIAPSVIANANLLEQRNMIHAAGCSTFLAGAVFLAAAYLKPPPGGVEQKSWTNFGAIAAGSLALGAAIGFGLFLYFLNIHNADQRLVDDIRLKQSRAESSARLLEEFDRRYQKEAGTRPSGSAPPPPMDAGAD